MIPLRWMQFCFAAATIEFATCFTTHEFQKKRATDLGGTRYGPPAPLKHADEDEESSKKQAFRDLVLESMTIDDPDHLPKILASKMDLILSLQGDSGAEIISSLVDEAEREGREQHRKTLALVDYILSFAEDFVQQANEMDSGYKHLLGKIVKAMTADGKKAFEKEELLDRIMEDQKQNFTPGFLRHLEGECDRIAGAPTTTPESVRLLQILRVIQVRVLEEIGNDMGESAVVLGQLMGYDDPDELLAVLDAGLTVRGPCFGREMAALTQEAIDGLKRVPGGAEQELIERVEMIDNRLRELLNDG